MNDGSETIPPGVGGLDLKKIIAETKPIFEIKCFERGESVIQEYVGVDGARVPANRRFRSVATMQMQTPQGIVAHNIQFWLDAGTLAEAFQRLQEQAEAAARKELTRLKLSGIAR